MKIYERNQNTRVNHSKSYDERGFFECSRRGHFVAQDYIGGNASC